jgi:excisionase family DNA binding protein
VQSKTTFRPACGGVLEGGADNLLSVKEAAARLGLCPASIYKICQRGELPHIRVLNAIRIAPADLAAFIDAHRGK